MRSPICWLFVVGLTARSLAQPAPPAGEPDYTRATELYEAASRAMDEGRPDDAARDFLAAYAITKDPVLFFKIGGAYEKAGNCREALGYYQRYLDEGQPADNFVVLTRERIEACTAQLGATTPTPEPTQPPAAPEPKPAEPTTPPAVGSAETPAETPLVQPSVNKDRAWLFVGGALAFVTAGAVLAYSTSSAEQDVRDLYIANNGRPPEYDANTKERYEDLIDEGRRYEYLAWTSFGLAAGCAIGATIFFLRDGGDVSVAPVLTPKETGVSATLRF